MSERRTHVNMSGVRVLLIESMLLPEATMIVSADVFDTITQDSDEKFLRARHHAGKLHELTSEHSPSKQEEIE